MVSLASTTGFVTADYEKWVPVTQFILFMLLFMGGCAGSTAGAMKAIRVLLFGKQAAHEFFRTMHPYGVTKLRLNGSPVTGEMMRSVSAFMGLYLAVYVVSVSHGVAHRGRTSRRPSPPWPPPWAASARASAMWGPWTTSCGWRRPPSSCSRSTCSPDDSSW